MSHGFRINFTTTLGAESDKSHTKRFFCCVFYCCWYYLSIRRCSKLSYQSAAICDIQMISVSRLNDRILFSVFGIQTDGLNSEHTHTMHNLIMRSRWSSTGFFFPLRALFRLASLVARRTSSDLMEHCRRSFHTRKTSFRKITSIRLKVNQIGNSPSNEFFTHEFHVWLR